MGPNPQPMLHVVISDQVGRHLDQSEMFIIDYIIIQFRCAASQHSVQPALQNVKHIILIANLQITVLFYEIVSQIGQNNPFPFFLIHIVRF